LCLLPDLRNVKSGVSLIAVFFPLSYRPPGVCFCFFGRGLCDLLIIGLPGGCCSSSPSGCQCLTRQECGRARPMLRGRPLLPPASNSNLSRRTYFPVLFFSDKMVFFSRAEDPFVLYPIEDLTWDWAASLTSVHFV